ncbi:MAG: LVIVD repeat-containing protein, partial [Actinomycetota bacterium]
MSLRARRSLALVVALAVFAVTQMLATAIPQEQAEVISDGFELVGHEPLNSRGMNAAPAVHGDYVYVGSRTDGLPHHRTPGLLVVDVSDPANPHVVHEIGPPVAGNVSETTRELRIWPQQEVLIVLTFGCSSIIHACAGSEVRSIRRYDFFDISGENAAHPVHVSTYTPRFTPHEMFLWVDPVTPADRALMFWSAPTTSRVNPSMVVTDISRWREGVFPEVNWVAEFEAPDEDRRLHSIAVSNDGSRTYLAFLGSGFLSLDTSEVADGVPNPEIRYVIQPEDRVRWSDPGAHTSARLFGTDIGFTTDEVYGDALDPITLQDHGCPWGWMRFIDLSDETKPVVISEYRVEENDPAYCQTVPGGTPANTAFTSYASHNPTFTDDLVFVTWHSAGLEAVDLSDPLNPTRAGKFKPEPLPSVATEDPALSMGLDKVVMWSYPIIQDGLIYVVDVRNGLYILRYTGAGSPEVDSIGFLEGNSNLGDALRYEPLDRCDLVRRQIARGGRPT